MLVDLNDDLNDDMLMLVDLPDDMWRAIAKQLAESDLASAVALKRCSSRFKDLAAPLVANAVERTDEKWRDAAAEIGGRGAATITGGLERSEVLTDLKFGGNQIRDEGAAAIAEALRSNAVLKELDLSCNQIGPKGGVAIGEALAVNGVLTNLVLFDNYIGEEGAAALASALRVNGVLTSLDVSYNSLGDEGKGAIRDAVSGREGFELEM